MFKSKKLLSLCLISLCLLLFLILLFNLCYPNMTIDASIASAEDVSTKEGRLLYFIDKNIEGMNSEYETSATRSTTKTLLDFAGNTYTLIECEPTGYMIMCDDSATMVEYAGDSPSPYLGLTENLYYGGPSFFFVYEDGQYRHTITNDILINNPSLHTRSADTTDEAVSISAQMHSDLVSDSNQTALNYIENGIMPRTEIIGLYGESWTCVNNMAFFAGKTTSTQIGYRDGGYCGYIAAAMLIGYFDTFIRDCIDDGWLYMSGSGIHRHFTGPGLVNRLFNQFSNGNHNSTSTTIRQTLNAYFKYYGYDLGSYDMITPFFSGTTLKNWIDKTTPIVLFGDIGYATRPKPEDNTDVETGPRGDTHAVVVYGYKKGGTGGSIYSFLAHYGWERYSTSTINYKSYSVFGSMYRISI